MRLLDLFCGAGGAAMGYHRAGFSDIVGVDLEPMPRYPFEFARGDALEFLVRHGREFDAIHASPPCQKYTFLKSRWREKDHADFISHVRALLYGYAVPWVIENVVGAPMRFPIILCGSMFGLKVRRHRYFESSEFLFCPPCRHLKEVKTVGVYGNTGGSEKRKPLCRRHLINEWKEAMGIDWMTGKELTQAIPPAYTEYIGRQLLKTTTRDPSCTT